MQSSFTLGEAAKATGRSKAAISRAISVGRLAARWDTKKGCYQIDEPDLFFAYPPSPSSEGLTLRAAADFVGKSKSTVLRAIQNGKVPAVLDAFGRYNIDPESVRAAYPKKQTSIADTSERRAFMAMMSAVGMWNNADFSSVGFDAIAKLAVAQADLIIAELKAKP